MKTNKRPQARKRVDRHTSHVIDKGRHHKGIKAPRYNRPTDNRWEA